MGPWFIRDMGQPYRPGCSYETLRRMVTRGRVRPDTVIRGPTTRQFWSFARNTPGVAHLMGCCHACHTRVEANAPACPNCNASFLVAGERQSLGLAPLHLLPGEADPSAIADAAFGSAQAAPPQQAAAGPAGAQPPPTPIVHAGPKRKKSMVPALTIAVSILGTATIAAIVWFTDTAGPTGILNPGSAAARTPEPDRQAPHLPIDATLATTPRPASEEPDANPDTIPEPPPELPHVIPPDPAPATQSIEPAAAPSEAPARALDSATLAIATASPDELRAMLREWSDDPDTNADRLRAAETRLQQLELRARYAPADADGPFSAGTVSRGG